MLWRYLKELRRQPGMGARPRKYDFRDHGFAHTGLTVGDSNLSSNLAIYIRIVRNQRSSSTCMGQMAAGAVDILTAQSPHPEDYGPASALYPYYNGRRFQGAPITDSGIDMRSIARAMQKFGVCDDRFWPFALHRLNRRPNWQAQFRAQPRSGCQYAFIEERGRARIDRVATALFTGLPVLIILGLTKEFFASDGGHVIECPADTAELKGWHGVVLVGHTPGLNRILNSWGDGWRDKGLCYLTDEYVASSKWAADPCILYGWDRVWKQ